MSGNQDIFSAARLHMESEEKNRIRNSNSVSSLKDGQTMANSPNIGDKKRKRSAFTRTDSTASNPDHLVLYEDDTMSNMPSLAVHLKSLAGFETEKAAAKKKSGGGGHGSGAAKLGTLLGVYLPSIQHILGVQMFLRLLWVVGIAGLAESFTMVFLCCLTTFLTSISISAIATNGVIDSGGAYFMISRNLGPEFGGAIGILYYLANTVATAMYLVGGVEILLVYMAPGLPQFGDPTNHEDESSMFNNFRLYATGFLLVVFVICAIGVKFVQLFAPISLACVFLSIAAVIVGAFSATPENSPRVCMLGNILLNSHILKDANGTIHCNKSEHMPLWHHYCHEYNDSHRFHCDPYFDEHQVYEVAGIPGFMSGVIRRNAWSTYMDAGESYPKYSGNPETEITQDLSTTFFVLLAIFFPSVTGIMTGANMSGDLADPQKSIPVGTIAGQLTTSAIYLVLVVFYAGTIEGALLRDKYGQSVDNMMIVAKLAWPNQWVLLVGSFTSCIGAGLQCLCSAPRLLQSIAKDDLIPFLRPFSRMTKHNEPFLALLMTTLIAECAVLIGGIDYIAPVVDFFFLMSYCFVNVACALQTLLKAPNWRPRFKYFHWTLAVVGALLNLFIMFSTHWYYALIVVLLCAVLYKYIEFKGAKKEWGDGMRGLALSTAQYSLLRVEDQDQHPKNWRPQLLLLVKLKKDREDITARKLLQLANQLKASRGLTIVGTLLEGELSNKQDRQAADLAKEKLRYGMREAKVKGFTEVALCRNVYDNVSTMIQCVGMGGLRANTVMIGWPYSWKNHPYKPGSTCSYFLEAILRATGDDMCLLVPKGLHTFPEADDQLTGNIDVWWIIHDGGLLILLPFLLKQHKVWRNCHLRVFAVAQANDNIIQMKKDLEQWVYQLRIQAEVIIVELADNTIEPYTYERTLIMEERAKLSMSINMSSQDLFNEPQFLLDRNRSGAPESMQQQASAPRKKSSIAQLAGKLFSINEEDGAGPKSKVEILPPVAENEHPSEKHTTIFHLNPGFDSDEEEREEHHQKHVKISTPGDDTSNLNPATTEPTTSASATTTTPASAIRSNSSVGRFQVFATQQSVEKQREMSDKFAHLDKKKLRKMDNAIKLNKALKEKSWSSRLVLLNLPKPPKSSEGGDFHHYMEYLEVLTSGLERVLLVRGSGKEVITIYS